MIEQNEAPEKFSITLDGAPRAIDELRDIGVKQICKIRRKRKSNFLEQRSRSRKTLLGIFAATALTIGIHETARKTDKSVTLWQLAELACGATAATVTFGQAYKRRKAFDCDTAQLDQAAVMVSEDPHTSATPEQTLQDLHEKGYVAYDIVAAEQEFHITLDEKKYGLPELQQLGEKELGQKRNKQHGLAQILPYPKSLIGTAAFCGCIYLGHRYLSQALSLSYVMASVASWLVYHGARDMAGRAGLDNMMEKCDREARALDQAVVMVSQNPKHAKYKETTSELIKAGHMKLLFNDTPQLQLA